MSTLIKAHNLTKIYGTGNAEVRALQGLTLAVASGEFVSIMGPSGSGKTTLMDILGCLSKPTSGDYYLNNKIIKGLSDNYLSEIRNEQIGFVFQIFNLLPRTTVLGNVELPMLYAGIDERERRKKAMEALESVGLQKRLHHYPSEISGGEQQRVAIARALVNDPAILLVDEPTGNLDSQSGKEIMSIFSELHDQGRTIIIVTHDPEVAKYADRIIFVRDGRIEQEKVQRKTLINNVNKKNEKREKSSTMASLVSGFTSGFKELFSNKMRSSLTILGIVIGVASVIGMLGIGEGARQQIAAQLEKMGSNVLTVHYRRPRSKEEAMEWRGRSKGLTYQDAVAIGANCSAVETVCPQIRIWDTAKYLDKEWNTLISGTMPDYQAVANHRVEQGRFFGREEIDAWAKVCLIGKTIKDELFGDEDPMGKEIRIRNERFTVIGIMEEKGAFLRQDFDDQILIPVMTAQKRFTGEDRVQDILVQAKSFEATIEAEKQIAALLTARHNNVIDFTIRSREDFRQTMEQTAQTFKLMLAGVAAISLLVGGIGIMNIMLVAITERTREIGIRKAIGAKRKDILLQFLIESMVLSFVGGIIGILLGVSFSITIGNLMVGAGQFGPGRFLSGGGQSVVTLSSILLAFLFATGVGIFFGMYPASKASKLDPVEALRYE